MTTKATSKARQAAKQAKSAALNKQYRHDAAILKAKGVLTSKVNARANITRATRTKINKYRDVIEGKVTVVKADKAVRDKYAGVVPSRGSFLVIPKEREKERAKIGRGMIQIDRPLFRPDGVKFGEEREIILPFKLTDMVDVAERLRTDDTLDGLKNGDEYFAFRIDGWASKQPFVDAEEMGNYINRNYAHLFKPKIGKQVVKYLTFIRYKASSDARAPEKAHTYNLKNKPEGKRKKENRFDTARRLNNDAARKRRQRAAETPTQREARKTSDARRTAQRRQRDFEGDK